MDLTAPIEREEECYLSLSPIAPTVSPLTSPPQSPRDETYDSEATIEDTSIINDSDGDNDREIEYNNEEYDNNDDENSDNDYEGDIEDGYRTQVPADIQLNDSQTRSSLARQPAPIEPLSQDLEVFFGDDGDEDNDNDDHNRSNQDLRGYIRRMPLVKANPPPRRFRDKSYGEYYDEDDDLCEYSCIIPDSNLLDRLQNYEMDTVTEPETNKEVETESTRDKHLGLVEELVYETITIRHAENTTLAACMERGRKLKERRVPRPRYVSAEQKMLEEVTEILQRVKRESEAQKEKKKEEERMQASILVTRQEGHGETEEKEEGKRQEPLKKLPRLKLIVNKDKVSKRRSKAKPRAR
ncbi:hypothetical protein TWF106_009554 [Orbilia oligospora]|uniref:Uncharacterized protein n=1 Tax=Orbilia oligospora TaxID=2813651 RepID=A0A7C8QIP3_ORBOL|nr:hypothetical protein TWF106_009554 [Orbilia oligospora]